MATGKTISETLIPLIVGIAALAILDNSLGNWSQDGFRKIFQHKEVRLVALFGAAYGANGGRLIPAFLAMMLYNFLENDTSTLTTYFGIDPFHNTENAAAQKTQTQNEPPSIEEIKSPAEKKDQNDMTPSSDR